MADYALKIGSKKKFLPVLRRGKWSEAAPAWLSERPGIDLSEDPSSKAGYEKLLWTLREARKEATPIETVPEIQDTTSSQPAPTPIETPIQTSPVLDDTTRSQPAPTPIETLIENGPVFVDTTSSQPAPAPIETLIENH